jgi:cytosine/uracil/thiamine/allantoin permease
MTFRDTSTLSAVASSPLLLEAGLLFLKILSSAETFLAFMSGYAVFLAPIAGIIASDFLDR